MTFTGPLRAPTADRRQKTSSQQSSDLRERKWPCGLTEGLMGSYGGESHNSVSPDSTVRTGKSSASQLKCHTWGRAVWYLLHDDKMLMTDKLKKEKFVLAEVSVTWLRSC